MSKVIKIAYNQNFMPDPRHEQTDVDIWSTDIMILIKSAFINNEEDYNYADLIDEDRTLEEIHNSENDLLNALRRYYQMHLT